MAKVKKWSKRNRIFLNTAASNCDATVMWYVNYRDGDPEARENYHRKSHMEAECNMSSGARNHWVGRRGDLRALRNMRKEIDAFEDACLAAFKDAEEFHAKSEE